MAPYLEASAEVSPDGWYRYWLSRRLSMGERTVLFVGLNPSKADARQDDPTIRRCVDFARRWGFDWLLMGNLYAYRATDPRDLRLFRDKGDAGVLLNVDPVGPGNVQALEWMSRKAEIVVAAWGAQRLDSFGRTLAQRILSLDRTRCLGANKDGSPKHPLYLRATTPLVKIAPSDRHEEVRGVSCIPRGGQ